LSVCRHALKVLKLLAGSCEIDLGLLAFLPKLRFLDLKRPPLSLECKCLLSNLLLKRLHVIVQSLGLKLELTLFVLLVMSVEVLRIELLPETAVLLLQGYLLAHQYLDVLLDRLRIS